MRYDTIKLPEENVGKELLNIGLSNEIFFNMTPKAQLAKKKVSKLDQIKLKNICTAKETVNKIIREKFFTNHRW